MIKGEKPFLNIKIENIKGTHLYEDESCTYKLIIKKLDMKNLLEPNDKDYCNIMTNIESNKTSSNPPESEEIPMITLKMHYNLVNGLMSLNKWKVFEEYEVKIVPLNIRMTEEIYNHYYEYIFSSQIVEQTEKEHHKGKNEGTTHKNDNINQNIKKVYILYYELYILF